MDTRFQPTKVLDSVVILQKASGQGVRMHPPMVLLAMVREGDIISWPFSRYQEITSSSCEDGNRVITTYGGLSETVVGDAAVRDRGKRSCGMIVGSDLLSLHPVLSPYIWRNVGHDRLLWFRFNSAKKCLQRESYFICRAGDAHEKSTDKLSDVVSTEKAEGRPSPSQKNNLTPGFGSLYRRYSRNSSISPRFHPPSFIPTSSGADGMQHHKHAHVRSPALLQLVTELTGFDEGRGEGTCGGLGRMGGVFRASGEAFFSKLLNGASGSGKEGPHRGLGGKASFACLNKLFKIDAKERHYKTLLSARNLMAVVRKSRIISSIFSPGSLPKKKKRRNPSEGSGQKRGVASPPKKAPAKKRKLVKNGKGVKEPTPPKVFALPPITHEAEVIIEEPVNPAPHSISSGPGHVAGLNHSSTSLAAVARLANLAEEAASINHPGSLNPDVDAAEAVCATPMEEAEAESQSQPSDDPNRLALVLVKGPPSKRPRSARNLRSGLIGRLQDRQQEIEVSCSSAYDAHPEGGQK
ncbi:hypothetical protein CK203_094108 [Vitis vinifera]|uniref:Uncharacterized protein n=1 Tax=Vitis vinifera TaxID=29760 RepID=A0A438CXM4_VITVI|nr:hypothetical protein CK203_094108 [Vitis vinifera]